MSEVVLTGVEKAYGGVQVLHGIDLAITPGEFVVFVGPSGCGKSTLLRMIAGLEHITGGTVAIGGRVVNDLPAPQRGIAMVFQSYALYPHMTVRQNIGFGLEMAKRPRAEIDAKVEKAAGILQLGPYLDRMPRALSGGQRQRVAIGRAIVREPQVFLFDEPLSNLDAALRGQTRLEIARLHAALSATMIYVTHDQTEAMTLADRIVVLNAGRIEQVGTPLELYRTPVNEFVAGFIGGQTMNILPVTAFPANGQPVPGGARSVGIRPEHLRRVPAGQGSLTGRVDVVEEFGEHSIVHLKLPDGRPLTVKLDLAEDSSNGFAPDADLHLVPQPEHLHYFDAEGRRL
jgi:multiple sugar transport system ATP-binding protein/alpha-glucoside transport system ATP-binding protein